MDIRRRLNYEKLLIVIYIIILDTYKKITGIKLLNKYFLEPMEHASNRLNNVDKDGKIILTTMLKRNNGLMRKI